MIYAAVYLYRLCDCCGQRVTFEVPSDLYDDAKADLEASDALIICLACHFTGGTLAERRVTTYGGL